MSPVRSAAAAIAVVVLTGACSDSSGTTEQTSPATDAAPAQTTAAPADPATTSTTSTSTTTTTTTSTTVAPTTNAPPSTTEPADDAPEVAVPVALVEAREAYLFAVYNLDAPDALDGIEETHAAGSPSYDLALENVQTLLDNGWLARPNPDVPDTITIESDVLLLDDTTAEVVACVVGAGVVYAPGAGDGGSDLIINDEIEAALNRVTMVLEDGRWKLREGANLSLESGTACSLE